ncbi:MAG: translation initiation factor IF-2 [Candidatus Neomarinimicrobiota bacterium]
MAKRPVRIFQIAKELNISHTEIVSFLNEKGIEVASHMSPVDDAAYQLILTEFSKDKEAVERFRKEQVRREIHDTRLKERQDPQKIMKLLSLQDQRKLEEKEKLAIEDEKKLKKIEEQRKFEAEQKLKEESEKIAAEKKRIDSEAEKKPEPKVLPEKHKTKKQEKKSVPAAKKKLQHIDLGQLQSQIGFGAHRKVEKKKKTDPEKQRTAKDRVKQTLARMDVKSKKKVYKKDRSDTAEVETSAIRNVKIAEFSSVDELSKLFDVKANEIIQKCLELGFLASINQRLDWDFIELLADEFGCRAQKIKDIGEDVFFSEESEEDIAKAENRPPVVTVMGHVDHGKTTMLDYIRKANVAGGESGGITQHIGTHQVQLEKSIITFLDTPGHEAFTAMRARGAQITDMVILVVAANDGVMPQTIEAIDHAKAADVPLIVAINKIDLPDTDIDRVKRELSEHGVLVEDWGGKIQAVPISAKTGAGIDDLLNSILIEAEMLELKSNPHTEARGTIIDSRLDKGHGPMATVLIQKGTLKIGDPFICNNIAGKVRAIMSEFGKRLKSAGPSDGVQVLGFDQVPQSADIFAVVKNERDLKRIAADRQRLKREIDLKKIHIQSLDALSDQIREGAIKALPIIIKGDVDGSIDALSESLKKLSNDEVGVTIVHKSVGMVSESDVLLASASNAVILGFHVQVSANAKLQAIQEGVEIRNYNVIYNAIEEVKQTLEGLLEPDLIEEIIGRAVVQTSFKIPKIGMIAGSKVTEGIIVRGANARVIRQDDEIGTGIITSLKRFKDDAKEVKEGLECGIGVNSMKKYEEGDEIICFKTIKVKRKLELN